MRIFLDENATKRSKLRKKITKDNTFVDQIFVDTYKQANVSSDNLLAQNLKCIESSIKQVYIII